MSKNIFLDLRFPKNGEDPKKWVISSYAEALSFPEYWQPNWDSFEEILLEKLKDKELSLNVRHIAWAAKDYEKLGPYKEIIDEVTAENLNFIQRDLEAKSCRAGVIAPSAETSPQTSQKLVDSPNSPFSEGEE